MFFLVLHACCAVRRVLTQIFMCRKARSSVSAPMRTAWQCASSLPLAQPKMPSQGLCSCCFCLLAVPAYLLHLLKSLSWAFFRLASSASHRKPSRPACQDWPPAPLQGPLVQCLSATELANLLSPNSLSICNDCSTQGGHGTDYPVLGLCKQFLVTGGLQGRLL